MTVAQHTIRTARGDDVTVTLMDFANQAPTVLIALDDPDDTLIPTAEFTVAEAAELREMLRKLLESAERAALR